MIKSHAFLYIWHSFNYKIMLGKLNSWIFLLFFITAPASTLLAQEGSLLFNRTSFSIYNPAYTGTDGASVSFNTRSQWKNIEGAPRTNYLIYHMPKKKNVHLGFTAQNDRVFVENKTFFTVDYNYQLQLTDDRFLYLGLKGGGFYNNIDVNGIERIYNDFNPALSVIKSYFTPVIGVGMHYKAPNYFLGIGVPSIFNNKRFEDTKDWETTASDYSYIHFSAGGSIKLKDISLNPMIVYRSIPNSPNLFSGTVDLSFKEKISIGAGYSNNENMAVFITSKNKWGFEWGYGYEFTSTVISDVTKEPAHEIMVRINLEKKAKPEEDQSENKEDEKE